jgi:hypothetical protein
MAFILVFTLLNLKAYSFMQCQIGVLHVQSKLAPSKAALQRTHGLRHHFFIFYRAFWSRAAICVAFLRQLVAFCKCITLGRWRGGDGNPLADVPFSC